MELHKYGLLPAHRRHLPALEEQKRLRAIREEEKEDALECEDERRHNKFLTGRGSTSHKHKQHSATPKKKQPHARIITHWRRCYVIMIFKFLPFALELLSRAWKITNVD
jgi:hypothetical protein